MVDCWEDLDPMVKFGWTTNRGQEKGKSKGKSNGKNDEHNTTKFKGSCYKCGKWCHQAANCWHGKVKQVHQIQSGAVSAKTSSSSSQSTVKKTNGGAKEVSFVEKVQENTEIGWLFMIAEVMTINQLTLEGSHSLVVDSGAYVHVCSKGYSSHLPERWRGLDLRSASGKMLKV